MCVKESTYSKSKFYSLYTLNPINPRVGLRVDNKKIKSIFFGKITYLVMLNLSKIRYAWL